ncbi:hypothetical protein EDB85DRAFT_2289729 [Lactarius pseudohatsudake]|nr:hypothetical protein EDB85DRAFT_2289729 [Lactarius pseudohatsudake]
MKTIPQPVAEQAGEREAVYRIFQGGNAASQPLEPLTDEEGPTDFYIDTKPSSMQYSPTSTDDIAVEHPSTGILGSDIGEDDDDKIIKNATSSRRPLSLRLSVRKRTTLCTHRLSHQSLSQSSGQQFQKRSSFQRHRRHQCLRWLPRKFPSPSSPALLNRGIAPWPRRTALRKVARNTMFGSFGAIHAAATLRELDPRGAERRWGYSDVYWGGRGRGHRGRRRRGMLVDQEIGADAMTGFSSELPSSSSSAKELLEASSSPSLLRSPTPSVNSNSASTASPLLLLALSPPSSSSSTSSRRILASSSNRAVDLPIKDMIREELELELDEGRNLDLDSDIGDKDRIIGQIQDFIDENDDIFRANDREKRTASFQAIYNGKFEVDLDD